MNKNNVSRPDALHKAPPTASEHSTRTLVVTEPVEEMDSRPTDTTTSSPRSARSTAEPAHIPTTRPKSISMNVSTTSYDDANGQSLTSSIMSNDAITFQCDANGAC